jgi:hypothetical protein
MKEFWLWLLESDALSAVAIRLPFNIIRALAMAAYANPGAAALIFAAAVGYGAYRYVRGSIPISAGPMGNKEARTAANAENPASAYPGRVAAGTAVGEKYHIYGLALSGCSIFIGQESAIKTSRRCNFAGGGNCVGDGNLPPDILYTSPTEYDSEQAATQQWCADLAAARSAGHVAHWAVAGDDKAEVYGQKCWIGTAPSC